MSNVSIISDSAKIKPYLNQIPDKRKLRGRNIDYLIYNSDYNKDNPPRLDEEATIDNINRLIKRSGLSNEKIAESLFVTKSAVNKWRHHCLPDVSNLFALCKFLGVKTDKVLVPVRRPYECLMITPCGSLEDAELEELARIGDYYKMIILLSNT
jgi:transcriptional regulator with XRE-family HTH domain